MIEQHESQTFGAPTSDDLVQLEQHVRCRLSGRIYDFRMLTRDNGLVPQGHALTYYAKRLDQQGIMESTAMPIQANEIEVR